MKGLFAQNGSPISLMLLHVVDRVGRPINQVSLSFIKPETSEGDFMFFPQIFWENTQFYLRPFFFFLTFKTQHVILYLILLTQHIKFPVSLMFPSPQQNRTPTIRVIASLHFQMTFPHMALFMFFPELEDCCNLPFLNMRTPNSQTEE